MIASKFITIGIIAVSLIIGLVAYYILNEQEKTEKIKALQEIISQMMNFIIFIWIGKVVWNLPVFVRDPMAVLAYPSDAMSFYIAVILTTFVLVYKSIQKQFDLFSFLLSAFPVLLVASFVYEFLQLMIENHTYNFGYFILIAGLLFTWYFVRKRKSGVLVIFTAWAVGVLCLIFYQPFVTLFGYIIDPWFIVIFYIGTILLLKF